LGSNWKPGASGSASAIFASMGSIGGAGMSDEAMPGPRQEACARPFHRIAEGVADERSFFGKDGATGTSIARPGQTSPMEPT